MSEQPDGGTGWIVAGVDGSESSKLALRWALRQAALTGSRVEGNSAGVLINASKDADLLVLGNRGYGGFTEALLGSVSQHAGQQATCPVVIVR